LHFPAFSAIPRSFFAIQKTPRAALAALAIKRGHARSPQPRRHREARYQARGGGETCSTAGCITLSHCC